MKIKSKEAVGMDISGVAYDKATNRHYLECFNCEIRLIKLPNLNEYYCPYCNKRYSLFYTDDQNMRDLLSFLLKYKKELKEHKNTLKVV